MADVSKKVLNCKKNGDYLSNALLTKGEEVAAGFGAAL